jgi:hypothetical protein
MACYDSKGYYIPDTPRGDLIKVLLVLIPGGLIAIGISYGIKYYYDKKKANAQA